MFENQNSNIFVSGILPSHRYRFFLARNTHLAEQVGTRHNASEDVIGLIGETMMGAYLIASANEKNQDATVSLQLECDEPVGKIISFASTSGGMRSYVSNPEASFDELAPRLEGGLLQVNRWLGSNRKVYSSTIQMRNAPLEKNLEEYIARSEQIQTFLRLESGRSSRFEFAGYLFQALPDATYEDTDAILDMLAGKSAGELMNNIAPTGGEDNHKMNTPLSHSLEVKVLNTGSFYFYCDCSRKRVKRVIQSLGEIESHRLLDEHGRIEVKCEFCNTPYLFSGNEIEALFSGDHE